MRKYISLAIICLILSLCINVHSVSSDTIETLTGTTLYVDDDGTADYTKIQDAIDNASEGDTVFVYNGTYYENILVDKTITLQGEDKNTTVIDGGGEGNVIFISADNVTISGFTIQCGGDSENDGGIFIKSPDNLIIQNKIINNERNGIYFDSDDSEDSDEGDSGRNNISRNYISENKYGIYSFGRNEHTIIYRNIIEQNSDSGIILSESIIVKGNIITYNSDKGINCKRNCQISNNIISNNKIGLFFGFYDQGNEVSYNKIIDNKFGIDTSDCEFGQMMCINYFDHNNFADNDDLVYNYFNWFNFKNNYWGKPCFIKYIFPFNFDLNPAKEPFEIDTSWEDDL